MVCMTICFDLWLARPRHNSIHFTVRFESTASSVLSLQIVWDDEKKKWKNLDADEEVGQVGGACGRGWGGVPQVYGVEQILMEVML